jgi:hypothetical protein
VHPRTQELFDLLQLLAEPLGDCLAPDRKLTRPRLTAYVRQAEKVKGLRFALPTPLAPFACPAPKLDEARFVRVQFEVKPVEACPQVAQKLLGVVFVLEADDEIVTVPHDDDVTPCVPAAPLRRPEVKDIVQVQVCQEWTCYTSYKVANLPIEFSTSIPRTQLRPGYGEGFLGAPLQSVPSRERPAPQGQGDPRGTSRTHRQHNPGGAQHV